MHELMEQRVTSVARVSENRRNFVVAVTAVLIIVGVVAVHLFA